MKIFKLIIPFVVLAFIISIVSCSDNKIVGGTATDGPQVLGKLQNSTDEVWIPYSSGDATPTIATEQWVKDNTTSSSFFKNPITVEVQSDTTRLSLDKYSSGTGHTDAPANIDDAQYLFIGGREYGYSSYRLIGFGYRSDSKKSGPVVVGYQETSQNDDTFGDFVVGTRSTTTGTPKIRFRITSDGYLRAADDYVPASSTDLVPKSYVDKHLMATKKPENPVVGQTFYNPTYKMPEFYDGHDWRDGQGNILN